MTEAAKELLMRFESLSIEDRRMVAVEIRRRQLEDVLDHAGKVELELDQEELHRLREIEGRGLLAGKRSLTEALLNERRRERAREDR